MHLRKMFLMCGRLQFLDLLVRMLVVHVLLQLCYVSAGSLKQDAEALVSLKSHFLAPLRSNLTGWNPLTSPCTWDGISCWNSRFPRSPVLQETAYSRPGIGGQGNLRVVEIYLSGLGLSGELSEDIGNLDALISLDLSHNLLSGVVPSNTWQLPYLQVLRLNSNNFSGTIGQDGHWVAVSGLKHLDLSDNSFGGPLPRFSQFFNLTYLSLASNFFEGRLPNDVFLNGPLLSHLDVSDNSFTDSLPAFFRLPSLRYFNVSRNRLDGQIPTDITKFPSLSSLDMSNNRLSGNIPYEIGRLASLKILVLGDNRLTGSIPSELGNCIGLAHLDLANGGSSPGSGFSGSIPPEIGQLRSLSTLRLSGNILTGTIPKELGNCAELQVLALDDNELGGSIPWELWGPRNLTVLLLNNNQLSGAIPTSLANSNLVHLDLSNNMLNGSIPAEMGLLSSLSTLCLRNNQLIGEIPTSLGSCQNLVVLDLAVNFLSGAIPMTSGGTWSRLEVLRIDHNLMSGNIPEELGMIPGLFLLDLSNNFVLGSIPTSLGRASNLTYLSLGHNSLSGVIPKELGNLNLLQELDLSHNLLSGCIPPELSNLTRLSRLSLGGNNLSGTIPVAFNQLVSLQYLNLGENALTGDIPVEITGCQGLKHLSLHGNQLTGTIPVTFANLTDLQELLDLSFNRLTGTIPLELNNLVRLEALNLSNNQLSGSIPQFLLELGDRASLVQLNLSYNRLRGDIPQRNFTTNLSSSSFAGNEGLCGLPLAVPCSSSPVSGPLPEATATLSLSTPAFLGVVIAVAALTVTLVLALGAVAVLGKSRCLRRQHIRSMKTHSSKSLFRGSMSGRVWDRNLTFWDIMEATDELSSESRIGFGSYGTVYKAAMLDGEMLAVKVLEHNKCEQLDKKTTDGIVDLCKLRHRHLLRLLGFCLHRGRNLLIYEYMTNGSLWDHLHGASYVALSGPYSFLSSPEGTGNILTWPVRYEIAVGSAKAISYLHHDCIPRIIHGNIKSTNILLDTHMVPYVSDYGLAGLQTWSPVDYDPTTSASSTSCGYLSPEYSYTKQGSEESDVYSFGVVLMELITGRMPADSSFPYGIPTVVAWVRYCRACRAPIDRVLDTNLQTFISDLERYEMLLVLKIAYLSTKDVPSERPSMRNVVDLLKEVKRQTMTAGPSTSSKGEAEAHTLTRGFNCGVQGLGAWDGRGSEGRMCDTPGTTGNPRLDLARLFLRAAYSTIDPVLPDLLEVLQSAGASECWHKHGTFFEHLLHVYQILKLWGVPDAVARCGLFHSSYSNSYVNLAIFKPNVERQRVRDLVGDVAEELIHLFCIVPRHELIFELLLFKYTDEQLRAGLQETEGFFDGEGNMRVGGQPLEEAVRSRTPFLPREGMTVQHIRTGEELQVSRHLIAIFLTLTMADFIDQLFSWQDGVFDNADGKLEFRGNGWRTLWPGDCKPGLWMSAISRMGVLLNILVREEKLEAAGRPHQNGSASLVDGVELVLPTVFNTCSVVLPPEYQIRARDLYTQAMGLTNDANFLDLAEPLLAEACLANPWTAEPHLALAQIHLSTGRFEIATTEAEQGLQLLLEWGTNWDKKMSWEGWIAWARVLLQNARAQQWPTHAWGIINLGLVK